MKRLILLLVLGLTLAAGSSFAMCGKCGPKDGGDGHSHQCSMGKAGDNADVLKQASEALKTSNPDLSEKVQMIADHCCNHNLHE